MSDQDLETQPEEPAGVISQIEAQYASEEEVAEAIGVKVCTLRTMAARRRGPAGRVKVGRRVYYRREALLEWFQSQESEPVTQRQVG